MTQRPEQVQTGDESAQAENRREREETHTYASAPNVCDMDVVTANFATS